MSANSHDETGGDAWSSRKSVAAWGFWVMACGGSLAHLYVAFFIVPRFAQIYADMLRGRALATAALVVVGCRWWLLTTAMAWPVLAFWLARRRKQQRDLVALVIVIAVGILVPAGALSMPLSAILKVLRGGQ